MAEERKRFGVWPWVVALLIGLPALYVASFGPVCWWTTNKNAEFGEREAPRIYWPIGWVCWHGPGSLTEAIRWYATLGGSGIAVPAIPGRWDEDREGEYWMEPR
jgi:hypothetical protein